MPLILKIPPALRKAFPDEETYDAFLDVLNQLDAALHKGIEPAKAIEIPPALKKVFNDELCAALMDVFNQLYENHKTHLPRY